jgi:hypothetical protein
MASCASCGADGIAADKVCYRCGAGASRELELDVRSPPRPRAVAPRRKVAEEVSFELAVDPRARVAERTSEGHGIPTTRTEEAGQPAGWSAARSAPVLRAAGIGSPDVAPGAQAAEVDADARMLADYGEPPRGALMLSLYAWRVLKRQRQLKTAHAARCVEAEHAGSALEAELVAFAGRVRPLAEKHPAYAVALDDLRRAEAVLRSRDEVLAAEQDAQKARLAQVDARLATLEEELTRASAEERATAHELSSSQAALAREEAKLKRAEAELRAAQHRSSGGTAG